MPSAAASSESSAGTGAPPSEPNLDKPERCRDFEHVPIPPADEPSAAELAALAKCEAETPYYGYGSTPDYAAARKCAYVQRTSGASPVFGGANLLMMLYANGRSVPQNFDLALRFACESDGAPFEISSAVAALLEARDGAGLKGVLDVCDFTTSGYRAGFCAARDERVAAVQRNARKAKAVADLPVKQVAGLERAARKFIEARGSNEVDDSGTLRSALRIAEEARLSDEYVAMLEHLTEPAFQPPASATQVELDAALVRLMRCKELGNEVGELLGFSRQGIRATQAQWAAYRAAWLALVGKARPSAVSAWKGWLTAQRLKMLADIPLCQ